MTHQRDRTKLLQLQMQPRETLNRVFTEHRALLTELVRRRMDPRLNGRVDPSDVVQETLLEANDRLQDFLQHPNMGLDLWLKMLAEQNARAAFRRHAVTKKRSILREQQLSGNSDCSDAPRNQLPDQRTGPVESLMREENKERLRSCLDLLNTTDENVVRLRYLEGLPLQRVADRLGMTRDATAKRAIRALRKLATMMGDL